MAEYAAERVYLCPGMMCDSCSLTDFQIIQRYLDNDEEALRTFEEHGIIPTTRLCGNCGRELTLRSDKRAFQCYKRVKIPNTDETKRCDFYASQFKETWMDRAKISPSANILFVNCFLRPTFSMAICHENLKLAGHTIVTWKQFCLGVCEAWMDNQEPIGGPGKVVEVAEIYFSKQTKYKPDMDGVWVFGGVERGTDRKFILPIESRDAATLIPLCQKHIVPGTTVYSDKLRMYNALGFLGYAHQVAESSYGSVHTNNIKSLWVDIKAWVLRASSSNLHYREYFAKYLFLYCHPDHKTVFHHFLLQIARFCPVPE